MSYEHVPLIAHNKRSADEVQVTLRENEKNRNNIFK